MTYHDNEVPLVVCGSLILSETTSVGPGQGHPAAALLLVGVGEDRSHGLAMFE